MAKFLKFNFNQKSILLSLLLLFILLNFIFLRDINATCGPHLQPCFSPGYCCCDDSNPSQKLICSGMGPYFWFYPGPLECTSLICQPPGGCGSCTSSNNGQCCNILGDPYYGERCNYPYGWVPDSSCGGCGSCTSSNNGQCCNILGDPYYGERCNYPYGWVPDSSCIGNNFPSTPESPFLPPITNSDPSKPIPSTTNPESNQQVDSGDPVSTATGEFYFAMDLINLSGPMNLAFGINYGSQKLPDINPDGLPQSFESSATNALAEVNATDTNTTLITFEAPKGEEIVFEEEKKSSPNIKSQQDKQYQQITTREWKSPKNTRFIYQLKETKDYFYVLNPEFDRVSMFKKILVNNKIRARIQRIEDRNGNSINYEYADDKTFLPKKITDGLGREIRFNYSQLGDKEFISSVEDHGNRLFGFTYGTSSGRNVLTGLRDAENASTGFRYQSNELMSQIKKPNGNFPYTQSYTDRGVVITQKTHFNNTTTFSVFQKDANTTQTITNNPDGTTRVFEHGKNARIVSTITDEVGNTIIYETDPQREQIMSVTDRTGNKTFYTYHRETGKIKTITNPIGAKREYGYLPQEQTFTNPYNNEKITFTFYNNSYISVPDGYYEFKHDQKGNLIEARDLRGKITKYTYNSKGQLLTATNALGEIIETNTYNTDGTLATKTYPDMGTIIYGYDNLKRLTKITYPDGTSETITYDKMDRVTSYTDANGNKNTYNYDLNGNLVSIVSPSGFEKRFEYDEMDRLSGIIDKTGQKTIVTYDSRERVRSVTTPDNIKTLYSYDPRGWVNSINVGGSFTKLNYNNEGIPTNLSTFAGKNYIADYDSLGFVTSISDPLGNKTYYGYDLMGRLRGFTEPLNRSTSFGYTYGFLTSVEKTSLGRVAYTRNDLNLVTNLRDLKGSEWLFDYTKLGRLISQTDPVGNKWSYEYDKRGRISKITYPDSQTQTITYDGNGNILRQQFSDGVDIQNQYDKDNRLVLSSNIQFSYDNENRITDTKIFNISFGAQYDAGGKLISVSYNNGQFRVNYVYEQETGRLKEINDTLTNTKVIMEYNSDNELISIKRPNNVNTTYSYDLAGRVSAIQHGSVANFTFTRNAAGEITGVNYTAPVEPTVLASTTTLNYDGASRIVGNGYETDAQGRVIKSPANTYKWDGASRLIGISGTALGYNGLGDLINRGTQQFFYNYAISFKPMVAEKSGASFTRFYVWTPEGRLLYMIDAGDGNKVYYYHFDQIGNTVAITDATGAVKEAYAYTPYGKIIGKKSNFNQPFTFLGEFGVRMEGLSGDIYQMRMRYYDPNTGRFLSKEPVWPDLSEPRSLNPYQYAFNSPVNFIDITGLEGKTLNDLLDERSALGFAILIIENGSGSFGSFALTGSNRYMTESQYNILREELLKKIKEIELQILNLDKLKEVKQFFHPDINKLLRGFGLKVDERGNVEVAKPPVANTETIKKDVGKPGRLTTK